MRKYALSPTILTAEHNYAAFDAREKEKKLNSVERKLRSSISMVVNLT